MDIVFISQYFYPEPFSNSEIVRVLQERGHNVEVVCCVPNYPSGKFYDGYSNSKKRKEKFYNADVNRVRTYPRGQNAISLILNYICFPFAAAWTIVRNIKNRDVAFVSMPSPLTQALAGIFLKYTKKVPLVYWVQDIWPESAIYSLDLRNPAIVRPLRWLCGWIYRRADIILVQSHQFPPMIERFGVSETKIRVLPNTAPANYKPRVDNESPAEALLVPQSGFRLMFAGNIGESQDFDTLIQTAALLRDELSLSWVVLGTGRGLKQAKTDIERLGLSDRFVFLGRHPMDKMPYFFAHADSMLVSLKDTPIFNMTVPYKVQCYLACGKPIIGSLSGEGARIIEESGAGYVAPASSPNELATTIRKMMSLGDVNRQKLAVNAKTYFDAHYSQSKVYGDLEDWLSEAASGKGGINNDYCEN